MRMAFFFDQSRCLGCNSCTVACKDYYGVNPGPVKYRKQKTHDIDDGNGFFYSLVMSCNHCETPACMSACGAGAITKRRDGIVVINRNKCQDLQSCITACPFAEPMVADDRQEPAGQEAWIVDHPMQKCNMCVDLLERDEQPICERSCPVRAIEVGDYNELLKKHPQGEPLSYARHPYAYVNNTTDTGPSFIMRPRKALKIMGPYK